MAGAILVLTSATSVGQEVSLVSPSAFVDMESPDSVIPGTAGGAARVEILFEASDFSSLTGPHWITQFAWRPDGSSTGPVTATADRVVYSMSTTERTTSNMSLTFDDNVGDDAMVVLDCILPCAPTGQPIGPAGGPNEFTIIWELDDPFLYDPSQGSLLLDFDLINAQDLRVDHVLTPTLSPTTKWIGGPLGSPTAAVQFGGIITEFTFRPIPEPSTAVLHLMGLAVAIFATRRRNPTKHSQYATCRSV